MDMNDNELIREGIKNSLPGDEIVIESKNEAGREVKTYMALGEEDFKKSIISPVDEKKKSIRIGQYVLKGSEIIKEIAVAGPSAKVYWNRRKFTMDEVEQLKDGATLNNYQEICEAYKPMKQVEDYKVKVMKQLRMAKRGDEIIRYKYNKGERAGMETYVCIGKDEVGKNRYREVVKDTLDGMRIVAMNSRQRMDLTEEEIIRRIPDKAEYLAPANEIEIQTKGNKYSRQDIEKMLDGNALNDEELEKKRDEWKHSVKRYEKKEGTQDMYKVNWYNRESGELIRQTELPYSQITKLEEKGYIQPEIQEHKVRGIHRRESSQQMER